MKSHCWLLKEIYCTNISSKIELNLTDIYSSYGWTYRCLNKRSKYWNFVGLIKDIICSLYSIHSSEKVGYANERCSIIFFSADFMRQRYNESMSLKVSSWPLFISLIILLFRISSVLLIQLKQTCCSSMLGISRASYIVWNGYELFAVRSTSAKSSNTFSIKIS